MMMSQTNTSQQRSFLWASNIFSLILTIAIVVFLRSATPPVDTNSAAAYFRPSSRQLQDDECCECLPPTMPPSVLLVPAEECLPAVNETSQLTVTLSANAKVGNSSVLEAAVADTYNDLNEMNFATCDPFYRKITAVEILSVTNVDDNILQFEVIFECRGCRGAGVSNARLFDEEAPPGRQLLQTASNSSGDCLCSPAATVLRAPTTNEYFSTLLEAITIPKARRTAISGHINVADNGV